MSSNDNNVKILKQLVDIKTSEYKEIEIDLTISKSGIPCLFESGGAWTNTSSAQIIADSKGNAKTPLYIFKHGDLCNKNHAVIPVEVNDLVFIAEGTREAVSTLAYRITDINLTTKKAKLTLSDFNDNILPFLAVANKSFIYHCRSACYIKIPFNKGEENNEQRAEA